MLTSDFREFAALLNSNAVEYLVVGGYADLEALERIGAQGEKPGLPRPP